MKNICVMIAVLIAIFSWVHVHAFELQWGDNIVVSETVNDDLYIAGGEISIEADIMGDLYIAGGELLVNSDIQNDLVIAGGEIEILGNIGDDVRAAGWIVEITGNVKGDLIIAGWDVEISEGVTVQWDLLVTAGRVKMNGNVLWKAEIMAWELVFNGTIGWDAELSIEEFSTSSGRGAIEWNLLYKSKAHITNLEESARGEVVYEKPVISEKSKKWFYGLIWGFIFLKILSLFVFATLFYLYFEKFLNQVAKTLKKEVWRSLWYGFLTIALIPIAIILLMITVIGIPFALLLLFVYVFMFVFLNLINVMVLGAFIIKYYKIVEMYKKIGIILWLSLVFWIINGIGFIVWLFTIGAFVIKKIDVVKSLR